MKKVFFLFYLFFGFATCALEVKKVAVVGNEIISNYDLDNYRKLFTLLEPHTKDKLSEKVILERVIELKLYSQYADMVGIKPLIEKRNAIVSELKRLGLVDKFTSSREFTALLDTYLAADAVLGTVLLPTITITEDELIKMKTSLQRNKDAVKLTKIKKDGSKQEVGWVALSELNPKLSSLLKKTKSGETSAVFEDNRFVVLDKENSKILAMSYRNSEGSVIMLSDVAPEQRKKIVSASVLGKGDKDVIKKEIRNQFHDIAFLKSFEDKRKKLTKQLTANTHVQKY